MKQGKKYNAEHTVNLKILRGIQGVAFQHPSDRAILNKLKALPLVDTLVGKLVDLEKRQMEMLFIAKYIHVTSESMPRLYEVYETACTVLDMPEPHPPLYLTYDPYINAFTTGCDRPFVCIHSATVTQLTRNELLFILGHELGHIRAGHVRYHTLAQILLNITANGGLLTAIPSMVLNFTAMPLLMLWSRRSEFTADRAGLLVAQDKEAVYRATMKLAGFPSIHYEDMRIEPFLQQMAEYRKCVGDSLLDNVFDLQNMIMADHPRTIERASQLQDWIDDGSFEELLLSTESERREMAHRMDVDPDSAELTRIIAKTLTAWSQKEFNLSVQEAARPIRHMLYTGASLRNTPVEAILVVELIIIKEDPKTLKYQIAVLFNRNGKPIRTTLEPPYSKSWDDCPSDVRHEFVSAGTQRIVRRIYSVDNSH